MIHFEGWMWSAHGRCGKFVQILVVKPEMKMPFKRIRQDTVVSAGFNWLWTAPICILF
jgi:hypothetical protein